MGFQNPFDDHSEGQMIMIVIVILLAVLTFGCVGGWLLKGILGW